MHIIIILLTLTLLHACATLKIEPNLPIFPIEKQTQKLNDPIPEGKKRVVFVNSISGSGYPVKITIDDKQIGVIYGLRYLQLYLVPGKYTIKIEYIDIWKTDKEIALEISEHNVYVNMYLAGINKLRYKLIHTHDMPDNIKYYQSQYYCSKCEKS